MARHRSPRGRAHEGAPPPASRRTAGSHSTRRLVSSAPASALGSTSVRRGAAVVAVAGGALSLMGSAAPAASPQAAPDVTDVAARSALPTQAPAVLMLPAVQPVVPDADVLDDPAPLVKAVQLAEEQIARAEEERAAAEARAAQEAEQAAADAAEAERRVSVSADCGLDTGQLGAVRDFVREAGEVLGCRYGVSTMYGVAGRAGASDHPAGKAIDFMIGRTAGDGLADCAVRNMDALGISYVIWRQRINTGSGWEPMEDRGGITANHMDHVHISFDSAGSGDLSGC